MRIFIKPKQELSQRKQEQGTNEIQRPFVLNPARFFSKATLLPAKIIKTIYSYGNSKQE